MKKFLLILSILVMGLLSCEQSDTISLADYSKAYYDLFNGMYDNLNLNLIGEAKDMISTDSFQVTYSHEDFIHYSDQLIKDLDQTLYRLDQLGPRLKEPDLKRIQSKLEYAIFDVMNILKNVRDDDMFNTLYPNQFTLYDDIYQLTYSLNDRLLDVYTYKASLDMALNAMGYPADQSYYDAHVEFILSYTYFESIIASQVATYQDYSGLQMDPTNPNIIETSDSKWYMVYESAYSVMLPQLEVVASIQQLVSDYLSTFELRTVKYQSHLDYFNRYQEAYLAYASVRALLPYEYFKRGDYKSYMHQVGMYISNHWSESNHPIYDYDPVYNDTEHFDIMQDNFNLLFDLLYNDHAVYMIWD